jgi:hypothetical protein
LKRCAPVRPAVANRTRAAALTIVAADHPEAAAGDRRESFGVERASSISGLCREAVMLVSMLC